MAKNSIFTGFVRQADGAGGYSHAATALSYQALRLQMCALGPDAVVSVVREADGAGGRCATPLHNGEVRHLPDSEPKRDA